MITRLKIWIALIALLMAIPSHAQVVSIQDSAFAQVLFDAYPAACPQLGELNTVQAASKTGSLSFDNRGVNQADEIKYFTSLTGIIANNNSISDFPDLDSMPNLEFIYLNNNKLSKLFDISYAPELKDFVLYSNNIRVIDSIRSYPKLKKLKLQDNWLISIPDFTNLTALEDLEVRDNYLYWDDLLPLTSISGFDTIVTALGQEEVTPKQTIHLYKGDSLVLDYSDDLDMPNVKYAWFTDNVTTNIIGDNSPILTIDSVYLDYIIYELKTSIEGVPQWSGNRIYSGEVYVHSYERPVMDTIEYALDFDCSNGYSINFSRLNMSGTLLGDFTYNLIDNNDSIVVADMALNTSYTLTSGDYRIEYNNGNTFYAVFDSSINIPYFQKVTPTSIDYQINYDRNLGYTINFSTLGNESLANTKVDIVTSPGNSTNVENITINTSYTLAPQNYTLLYTDTITNCTQLADSSFTIMAYPKTDSVGYDIELGCNQNFFTLDSILFEVELINPIYTLVNEVNQDSIILALEESYEIEGGAHTLLITDGIYSRDTIELFTAPASSICNCTKLDSIVYTLIYDHNDGYTISFSDLGNQDLNNTRVDLISSLDSSIVVSDIKTDTSYNLSPLDYTLLYTDSITSCVMYADSIFTVMPYPKTDSVFYNVELGCNENFFTLDSIDFQKELISPIYTLVNEVSLDSITLTLDVSYEIEAGIHTLLITDGLYNRDTIELFTAPEASVCHCSALDSIIYATSYDRNLGYQVSFDFLGNYTSSNTVVKLLSRTDSTVILDDVKTNIEYNLTPQSYILMYNDTVSACFIYGDTIISIDDYPSTEDIAYSAHASCSQNFIIIDSVIYEVELINPSFALVNTTTNNAMSVNLGEEYMLEPGDYTLYIKDGIYSHDTIEFYTAPKIEACNCLDLVSIDIESDVNCKAGTLSYTINNAPDAYNYTVLAHNRILNKTYTLTADTNITVEHGIYDIEIIDNNNTCSQDASEDIDLMQPEYCDVVIYAYTTGSPSTYYAEGEGQVQLINEIGKIIYKKRLPAVITTFDAEGSDLPSGLYKLLYEDGSNISLTIIR